LRWQQNINCNRVATEAVISTHLQWPLPLRRRPPDYSADQGCRFEIRFEKSRGFYGEDAAPFEARLIGNQWAISEIKSGDDTSTLKALKAQGLSVRDIAERTGLSKSTVSRRLGEDD
jgi:hypothetical protein